MITDILSILALLLMFCIIPTAWLVYKKRITFLNGVFVGTFLFLMSFGCSVYGVYFISGYSPIDKIINSTFESIGTACNSTPGLSAGELQMLSKLIGTVKDMYVVLIPSMVVLFCLSCSYVLLMLSKGIFALFKRDVSGFGRFCDLKMPKSALFVATVTYILSIIFGGKQIGHAFLNFSSIILSVTTVCGLSVLDYKLRKKIRFSVVRVILYFVLIVILSLIFGDGTGVFMFVGMFDSVFDFRKLGKKTDINNK